jgi:hypothetical protein
VKLIYFDASGGTGVIAASYIVPAAEKYDIEAIGVYGGNPAKPYKSTRDCNLDLLRSWMNHPSSCVSTNGGLTSDSRDMLFEEASSLVITSTDPVGFMTKLKHSRVLGRSPDRLDAAALTMHGLILKTSEISQAITPAEYMRKIHAV